MSKKAIPMPDIPRSSDASKSSDVPRSSNVPRSSDEPKPPSKSAVEIQQEYYEAVGGVDWELFTKSDRNFLLQKIAVALYGPPTIEGNLGTDSKSKSKSDDSKKKQKKDKNDKPDFCHGLKLQGYELRDEDGVMKVFNKICEQAKYSHDGENILIKILRVVCVIPKKEFFFTPDDYWVDLHNKKGDHVSAFVFHVFCIRQCISMKSEAKSCRIYIDHDARVYKNWDDYLTENTLPKSVLVVPENGEYRGTFDPDVDIMQLQIDVMPRVRLTVVPSPALGLGARVLSVTDTLCSVANVGALVGVVGALAAPAVAPVALGAAIGVGVVTGIYGIGRATSILVDRRKHKQDIGLGDSESRGCWINIMVSTAGLSCSAAGSLLKWTAATGTNVKVLMNAVQILQYTNVGTGIIGVFNSFGEMIYRYHRYDETPTTLEVFQFTTSVLFLGIGAMSNQTAQEIVQDAQANKINEVRDSLSSNAKRKMFDKVTAETRRVHGTIQGNSEVISALKKIENKDEFFGKLRGINKQLNKNKLRISLSPDGNTLINNQHNIGVADLQALGKGGRDKLFAKYGPAKLTTKNAPTRVYASNNLINSSGVPQSTYTIDSTQIVKITSLIITLSKMDQEYIAEILSDLSADLHDAFLLICAELIAVLIPKEIDELIAFDKNYQVHVIIFVFNYLKSHVDVDDSDSNLSFANVLKNYVRDGRIPKETILRLKDKLFDKASRAKMLVDKPHIFDELHNFRNVKFLSLEAGGVLKFGTHEILIKNVTIEKLEEWFEIFFYTQIQSEMLLNICFEIISSLTEKELSLLNDINPDDDAVKIVSYYLIFETEEIMNFLIEDYFGTDFLTDIAWNLKEDLLKWRSRQKLRKYKTCEVCQGRRYDDE